MSLGNFSVALSITLILTKTLTRGQINRLVQIKLTVSTYIHLPYYSFIETTNKRNTDTNVLSSFSSLTTVTALSFQSSMLCAEIPELTTNSTLILTIMMITMHFLFTVHYVYVYVCTSLFICPRVRVMVRIKVSDSATESYRKLTEGHVKFRGPWLFTHNCSVVRRK